MRLAALISLAVVLAACGSDPAPGGRGGDGGGGGDGGDGGAGGAGGSEVELPTSREEAAAAICERRAACDRLPDDPESCAAALVADGEIPDGQLLRCAACLLPATCDEQDGCDAACGPASFDLIVDASGFAPWPDATLHLWVVDATGAPVADRRRAVAGEDAFSVPLAGALREARPHTLLWFLDRDGDGDCGAADLSGTLELPATSEAVRLEVQARDAGVHGTCERLPFLRQDLFVTSFGFAAHVGKHFWAVLVDEESGAILGHDHRLVGAAGNPDFTFWAERLLVRGRAYSYSYWIDRNDTGSCDVDAPPTRLEIPPVTGPVSLSIGDHRTPDEAACGAFGWTPVDLVVEASGFDAWEGKAIELHVLGELDGQPFDMDWGSATIEGGSFSHVFPRLLRRDMTFELNWFVDVDDNGSCEGGVDVGATVPIELNEGHVRLEPEAAAGTHAPFCYGFPWHGFSLHVVGSGFGAFEGEQAVVWIVDQETGWVSGVGWGQVEQGGFTFDFLHTAIHGRPHEVLFFVDRNEDFRCNPGFEPAGRVVLETIEGDAAVQLPWVGESDVETCARIAALLE